MNTTDNSISQELVFLPIDKEPCEKCDNKPEIELKMALYTQSEFDLVLQIISLYKISREQREYVYNFYNRVFGTKKVPGCGKCFVNICKHLKNRYNKDYNT